MSRLADIKVKKGDTVVVKPREYLWRPITEDEIQEWRDSPRSKGLDSAGESKLAPRDVSSRSEGKRQFTVTRERVTANRGYSRVPKCCEVQDSEGTYWFVQRRNVAVVS